MSLRKKRSGHPRGEPRLRPYAEFTVNPLDISANRVPTIVWFNGCGTMTTKERWWRCVTTVYGELANGDAVEIPIAMDSDEKSLMSDIVDDINKAVASIILDKKIVVFIRAECRCIILDRQPKRSKGEPTCL